MNIHSTTSVSTTLLRPVGKNARLIAGVTVSGHTGKVSAALVAESGAGPSSAIEVLAHAAAQAPDDVTRLLKNLESEQQPALPADALASLGMRLAGVQSAVIQQMLVAVRVSTDRVLALVAHDPGAWHFANEQLQGYTSLSDATHLSHRTGFNVIDALPARDVAMAGQGGPVTALAGARLLQTRHRSTLLIDVGRTLRATYVPAESLTRGRVEKRPRVLSFDVGPGMALVDALAQKLTGGTQPLDAGGRLAVQGQQIPQLLAHWQGDPYFERPLPRWHPLGVRPDGFLTDSYRLAVDSNWSVRDLLCTATHFLAQMVADIVQRRLPAGYPVDELVLTGGGIQNGLLMRHIAARLPTMPIVRLVERYCPVDAFKPAVAAVVGLMMIDGQPATLPEISGASEPCLAGRLTPGSPAAWRRLLAEMLTPAVSGPALRSA
jgi:anhydro-N-acetylmuramic acid kinase